MIARSSFGKGSLRGSLRDGPYFAYLVVEHRSFEVPGPVPDFAMPLGQIRMWRGGHGFRARLVFTVPDVPRGLYAIQYCNDPCTVNGIGDLAGGWVWVGDTVAEARLLAKSTYAGRKIKAQTRRLKQGKELAGQLAASEERNATLERQVRRLGDEVGALTSRAGELRSELRRTRSGLTGAAPGPTAVAIVAMILLALLGILALLAIRRRAPRARGPKHPLPLDAMGSGSGAARVRTPDRVGGGGPPSVA